MTRAISMTLVAILVTIMPATLAASESLGRLLIVYPVIEVGGDDSEALTLHRVARIVDATPVSDTDALAQLQLTSPSFSGQSHTTLREVTRWLQTFEPLADFEVLGPERITIRSDVSERQIAKVIELGAQAIDTRVRAHWPEQYRQLQYRFMGKASDLKIHDDTLWVLSTDHLNNMGRRASVKLTLSRDNAEQTVMLWYEVSGETLAWRARDDIGVHQTANPDLFYSAWINLVDRHAQELEVPNQESRLTVELRADQVLTKQALEPTPAIAYGQSVAVHVVARGLRLTTRATAKETAGIGQTVKLASDSSNEVFQALVVAPGIVEINHDLPVRRIH